MNQPGMPRKTEQRLAWLLLAALLPMLTFMGHWPATLPLPGTNFYLTVPLAGAAPNAQSAGSHSHGDHCHGESSECGDSGSSSSAGPAFLSERPIGLSLSAALIALALLWWRPADAASPGPELRPPRRPVLAR